MPDDMVRGLEAADVAFQKLKTIFMVGTLAFIVTLPAWLVRGLV